MTDTSVLTGSEEEGKGSSEETTGQEAVNKETSSKETGADEANKEVSRDTTEEGKKASDKEGADDKSKDADRDKDKQDGAPDEYEDFTFPDGIEADEAAIKDFVPLAKELDLNQAQAQKLVDYDSQRRLDEAQARQEAWAETLEGWRSDAESDKEIGGNAFNDNIVVAKAAIDEFGTDELKAALDATGVGNHPEFIRFAYRIGKAISDDKLNVGGARGTAQSSQKTQGQKMYPSMEK